jgi:hypothetical protein
MSTIILMLALNAANASDTADATAGGGISAEDAAHAEYVRLSQELEKLATRNAWPGVERTYAELLATGVPPSFDDHMYGAHSARELGDITAAHQRLLQANALKEDRQVLDSLWEIDSNFGQVFLAADPGGAALKAEVMPFEPDQARAIEFAIAKVAETGQYDGYLPQGKYTFGDYAVTVMPRGANAHVDLRSGDEPKPPKKKKKDKE